MDTNPTIGARAAYLFVLPWSTANPGGVEQVVLNLYRHFEDGRFLAPLILVDAWDEPRPLTAIRSGRSVSFIRLRSPVGSRVGVPSLAKWAATALPELSRLDRFLRAHGVTHVNVHFPGLSALQFALVRLLFGNRLRLILSFHGMDIAKATATTGIERWLWRLLLRNADAVVGCSRALTREVLRFEPAVRQRSAEIHNGLDIAYLMSTRNMDAEVHPRLRGRPFILSVASYERKKGLDTLLRAFKAVNQDSGAEHMLALVGPDKGTGSELRLLANRLGISDRVVFCGEVPHSDLHVYYGAASVFCLASRSEPFGLVLLEAGAFRCPVVATSVGGIPEILANDVNARLVPADDALALAAQIIDLLRNREAGKRLGDALFEHVRSRFPWANAYNGYLKLCTRT